MSSKTMSLVTYTKEWPSSGSSPMSSNDIVQEYELEHYSVISPVSESPYSQNRSPKARNGLLMFITPRDFIYIIPGIIVILLSCVPVPLQNLIYGFVFDKLTDFEMGKYKSSKSFLSDVRNMCVVIMLLGIIKSVFTWFGLFFWMQLGERQQGRARSYLLKALLAKDMNWHLNELNIAGNVSQLNRCIEELRFACSEMFPQLVYACGSLISFTIIALSRSWALTLVILASAPIMGILSWLFSKMIYKASQMENSYTASASKILDWSFVSAFTVRVFNGKYQEEVKFKEIIGLSAKAFIKMANGASANVGLMRCLVLLMFVQGFWFGNTMIANGKLVASQVFTCFTSCLLLGNNLMELFSIISSLNEAAAGAMKLSLFLKDESGIHKPTGYIPLDCKGDIKLLGATFCYPESMKFSLNDVYIQFKPNELNYLIGNSGSGKSTIVSIIVGLYELKSGCIFIDGNNTEQIDKRWIRENITVLDHSCVLFDDSLKANIELSRPSVRNSVESCCNFALLDDVIEELPYGVDTVISSDTLSSGQIQRINIARARFRDTPILIFDEALSALDSRRKEILMTRIKEWRREKTTIFITHDFSLIDRLSNVILMEEGCVVYQGPYDKISKSPRIQQQQRESKISSLLIDDVTENKENVAPSGDSQEQKLDDLLSIRKLLGLTYDTLEKRGLAIAGIIFSLIGGVCSPIFSFCFSQLLTNMVQSSTGVKTTASRIRWSCITIGVCLLDGLMYYLSHYSLATSAELWIVNLRNKCLRQINGQEISFFNLPNTKPAQLTALLLNDTRDLRTLVSEFLPIVINIVVIDLVGSIWAIVIGWKLALVGLAFVCLIVLVTGVYSKISGGCENSYKRAVANLENHNHQCLKCCKEIISMNLQGPFYQKFQDKLHVVRKAGLNRSLWLGLGPSLGDLCKGVATGTLLYYGIAQVGSGKYDQSQFLQIITLLTFCLSTSSSLLKMLPDINRGQRAGTHIAKLLNAPLSTLENDGFEKPPGLHHKHYEVQFKHVNFKYSPSDSWCLRRLTFEIKSGECLGLVGESGSGKSTIAKLLLRTCGNTSCDITVAGSYLDNIDVDWLRDMITIVPQKPSFFEGTIYDNIIYGMHQFKVTRKKLEQALVAVNMYSLVNELPEGIYSRIGGNSACLLSTGQLQRIAIARALIRDPKILILDECTSNLDEENSKSIIRLLNELMLNKDMATLIITHDVNLMRAIPNLIVLRHGTIVETGCFNSLYNSKGEIYRLTRSKAFL